MPHFIIPPSHNRGRARWSEYPDPPDNPCPPPAPAAGDIPAPPRPASESLWFAPGAADLSRLPERSTWFEDVWHGLTSGAWPRGVVKKQRTGGDPAFIDRALKLHRQQEEMLAEIRTDGFVWLGGDDDDGHYIPSFTEVGRRSAVEGAHVVRRIVALTERKPMSGTTKCAVVRELRKEAAMLADYVVLNERVRGVIRVDNDMIFKSWADVHSWLVYLVGEGEIPCLPHLAVAKRSTDGSIHKPHFLILLPVGDEVRGDKRCRSGTRGLMKAVENGWIRALKGDPGGASNGRKIKSPTSPRMLVGIFNQQIFMRLEEMAETLDCRRFDDRRTAADQSGIDLKRSNDVFDETRERAWPKVAQLCDLGDPRYPRWLADEETFATGLYDVMIGPAVARHSGDKPVEAIKKIVMLVCRRVARDWDPKRVSRPPDRGAMGLPSDMPLEGENGKWVASGKWSSAKILCETLEAMADEIDRIEVSGRAARKVDLVDSEKWSKSTVNRRFDDAVLLSFYRCQPVAGKKGTIHPASTAVEPADVASDPCCNGEVGSTQIASPSIEPVAFDPCCPVADNQEPAQDRILAAGEAGATVMSIFAKLPMTRPGHENRYASDRTSATAQTAKDGDRSSEIPAASLQLGLPDEPAKPGCADPSRDERGNHAGGDQGVAGSRGIIDPSIGGTTTAHHYGQEWHSGVHKARHSQALAVARRGTEGQVIQMPARTPSWLKPRHWSSLCTSSAT